MPKRNSSASPRRRTLLGRITSGHWAALSLAVLLAGGAFAWSASEPVVDSAELADRRRKIADMDPHAKQELQRKYDTFRRLSEDERNQLRAFHARLQEDTRKGGQLKTVLQRYGEWLTELDTAQRNTLRAATTPQLKRQAVREILKQQEQRRQDPMWFEPWKNRKPPQFSPEQTQQALQVLEEKVHKAGILTAEQEQRLKDDKLQGTVRRLTFLEMLSDYRIPKAGPARDLGLSGDDMRQILQPLESPQLREFIQHQQQDQGRERPMGLPLPRLGLHVLATSLVIELFQELNSRPDPNLQQFLYSRLQPPQQQRLLETEPRNHVWWLIGPGREIINQAILGDEGRKLEERFRQPRFGPGGGDPGRGGPGGRGNGFSGFGGRNGREDRRADDRDDDRPPPPDRFGPPPGNRPPPEDDDRPRPGQD